MLHGLASAAALVLFADVAQAQQLAVPTLLEPTAGNEQVTLTWSLNESSDESSNDSPNTEYEYRYRADGPFGGAIKIPNSDSSNFNHTVTGLDNGTTYTFEIRSKRSLEVSRWSNSAEAIPRGPPDEPEDLVAEAGDPAYSVISLGWKAPAADAARAAVSGYLLEWSANSSGPWTQIDLSGNTGTIYYHRDLAAASTYHYRVYARSDASGDSDASVAASADTAIAPPGAPTNLDADPGDAQVTLKWDPGASSIDKYRYSTDDGANYTDIANSDAATTSHTVTGLTNGTAYTFEIQAHNTSGWSASSNQDTETPLGPPAAPTNLTANAVDPAYSAIELTWIAPAADAARAAVSGYLLEWSANSSGPWTQIDPDLGAHELELTHSGLAAASTYHYRVYARSDASGDSDASAVTSADTAIAPPAAPTNLTANAVDPAYSAIELTWTAPAADAARAAVSGYLLEWSANSSGPWTEIDLSGNTGTSYQHSGLAAASTYHYRVYARSDASGDSDASAVASADTAIAPPGAPTGLTADPGDAQVTLKWDDPGDSQLSLNNPDDDTITGYRYRQSTNGGRTFGTPIAIPDSNKSTTYHTVEDLTNGTKYTFEVESVRKGQNYSGWSNQATATPLRPRFVPQFAPAVVEPPLAEPQFMDVDPSSVHANNIQTLLAAGITTGCRTDPPMYCPDRAVTRAQMASFVVRALKMHTASPRKTERIIDVDPSSVHANNIDVLFAAGITTGCGTELLRYCPDRAVTRAQMASFLARALDLPAAAFARRAPKIMDLDSSSVHATNIKALFAARITTGCRTDPLRYCPDRPVTRSQMASFLVRAFDLD